MSLIAHYRLDGNADDAVGNNHGMASNVTWVDGKLGQATQFQNITNCHVAIPNDLGYRTQVSVSAWFKSLGTPGSGYHIITGGTGLEVSIPSDGALRIGINTSTGRKVHNHGGGLTDGQWHHVAMTYDGTTKIGYIDGVEVGRTTVDGTLIPTVPDRAIGTFGVGSNYRTNGLIDDLRIYDHALSKHEVKDLAKGLVFHLEANETGPKDKSLQGNTVVNNGAAYVENVPVGKGGYEFVSNSIDCGNLFHTTKDQTISIWVKPSNFSARRNFYNRNYGGEGTITQETNGTLNYYWGTNGGNSTPYQSFNSVTGLTLNQWNHVCLVRKLGVGGYLRWYINGVQTATAAPAYAESAKSVSNLTLGTGYTSFFNGVLADVRQYAEALTADDIKELYQRRASLDAQGNFYAGLINDTGIKQPLLLDYTQWQDGQTGSIGDFGQNGSTTENYRIVDTDPWGKPTVVWEARPDAVSGADGGWNSSYYPIDNTKMYRVSTWVKRSVTGNGTFYLGTNGGGAAVLNRSNNVANGNPYFDYRGGLGSTWVLVVGHIWPVGSGAGAVHPDTGLYSVAGGKIGSVGGNTGGDCVFAEGTTAARHRSYLYYSTDVNTRQQWCYPRMDVCDGTEPSIAELLAGFDSRNEELFRVKSGALPGQSIASVASGSYSEIGITDGLVAYYPLTKDAKDYSGNGNHGVVSGATPVGGGFDGKGAFSFDGTGDYIDTPYPLESVANKSHTVLSWVYCESSALTTANDNRITPFKDAGSWAIGLWFHATTLRVHTNGKYVDVSWVYSPGWHLLGQVYDANTGELFAVIDGERLSGLVTNYGATFTGSIRHGVNYLNGSQVLPIKAAGVKIFNRALSPEEIAVEYKRTGPAKMTQYNGRTYIQGQFKEVTA